MTPFVLLVLELLVPFRIVWRHLVSRVAIKGIDIYGLIYLIRYNW
jgi:hypothetical protein